MNKRVIVIVSIVIVIGAIVALFASSIYRTSTGELDYSDYNEDVDNPSVPDIPLGDDIINGDSDESTSTPGAGSEEGTSEGGGEESGPGEESEPDLCGNGVIDDGEVCDDGGQQCVSNGYPGYQDCNGNCDGYGGCILYPFCGDGTCDPDELATKCSDCFG